MIRWVEHLDAPHAGNPERVGGKAANLHQLNAAGLQVPPAFVVTADAFRAHFPDAAPDNRPAAPPLLPDLQEALDQALTVLLGGQPERYLVVRSSALGEDEADASFAGQHATYYYVRPARIADAVTDCWLSLWSEPAASYRRHLGPEDSGFAMAVIVQHMVHADRSGVCFTRDPTGANPDHAWIEATWGLGAALVDGRVSPDRLLMARSGATLRRHIGRKRHQVAQTLGDPDGARLEPVPAFRQSQAVLDDTQAAEVMAASLRTESLFGTPQDVEWAYQNGVLHVLQSRPITGMAGASAGALKGQWVLFKPLAENFTEPLTPMTVDLMGRVLPFGRFVDGRYYLNVSTAARLCPFRWARRELADVLLLRGPVPTLRWHWLKLPALLLAGFSAYLMDGIAWHRSARLTRDSLQEYAWLSDRLRGDPRQDALQAFCRLVLGGHPLEPMGRSAFYVNVSAGRYFLLMGVLIKLLARYAPGFDQAHVARLCSGDGQTFSRQLVESVRELANVARQDPALVRSLTGDAPEQLAASLATLPHSHAFARALDAFLKRFGHRCMSEMELATPRWREDPLAVLLMVRGYLKSQPGTPMDPGALDLLARDALRRALPRRWQQRLAEFLVQRIRYYVCLREDTRHYHAMAMDVTRGKLLALEQQLIADGRLRVAGDVFFLRWEEARALADGHLGWNHVAERIRLRRRQRQQAARAGAPQTLNMAEYAPEHRHDTTPGVETLTGQCASPGTAEGRVRIVLDPTTADLEPGDILVAPYTDPAWTPLFPLVSAVVVEVGSFLSHAGTLAREYRIPCLVEVAGCTRRLHDGQRIRVHAELGRVEVLAP